MTRLSVGISATTIEPWFAKGKLDGIGQYTSSLLRELGGRGDVQVAPISYAGVRNWRGYASALAGGRAFPAPYSVSSLFSIATGLPCPRVGRIVRDLDLFHSTDYRIPRVRNVPVVATLCDAIPLKYPDWANLSLRFLKNWGMSRAARWADHVIAISHAAVPDLVRYFGVPEERISVVHLGVDAEWFQAVAPEARHAVLAKWGLREGYFLFVGTLQPRKNVQRLLDAYEKLPRSVRSERQLVLAGRYGWGAAELLDRIHALEAQGQCRWLDYVPDEDLRALYAAAWVFVFPSLYEGFGLPVIEAFASGVPVVASNTTSIPEIAGDAALLVDPESTTALSEAMAQAARGGTAIERLVDRGREQARRFTWSRCAEETLAVYRNVLARHG